MIIDDHRITKTKTVLLATLLGGIGAHRFYLYGRQDRWGWIYLLAFSGYIILVLFDTANKRVLDSYYALFPLPIYAAFIESLVIGVTPDDKWNQNHNLHLGCTIESGWSLAALLVATMLIGFTALVASIARATDLFFTSGAFG